MIDIEEIKKQIELIEGMGFVVMDIILPIAEREYMLRYSDLSSASIGIMFSSYLDEDDYKLNLSWFHIARKNPDAV